MPRMAAAMRASVERNGRKGFLLSWRARGGLLPRAPGIWWQRKRRETSPTRSRSAPARGIVALARDEGRARDRRGLLRDALELGRAPRERDVPRLARLSFLSLRAEGRRVAAAALAR